MGKNEAPPPYGMQQPMSPNPTYQGEGQRYDGRSRGYQQDYYNQQPGPSGYYGYNQQGGPFPGGQGPYPPQGVPYGPPGQGRYGPPQGYYPQERRRGGPGLFEGLLAGLACCCCLDLLF